MKFMACRLIITLALVTQDYDGSGTEDPRITLPNMLSRVVKLKEVENLATC